MTTNATYDVAIIGGGINGCGCAAEAAMRGLSVFLCEQGDIASQTSSRSSQLIHGGLRYLEHYDIALVKKALNEQQILMDIAPHLVHPLPFILPCDPQGRSPWLLRAGLFLYDHLSNTNSLPNSQHLHRHDHAPYFIPLATDINDGFLFYDCQTNDARLTLTNALQAHHHHAVISNYTTLLHAHFDHGYWQLTLSSDVKGTYTIQAKTLINAAGPWIASVSALLGAALHHSLQLVKGSHLVVHRLYEGQHAYLLQHTDQRVIFVIPYYGYSLIGTTDVPYQGDLKEVSITPEEIAYLSSVIEHHFQKPIDPANIITSWSGVRTLLTSSDTDKTKASALSRDYALSYDNEPAPIVTIYGGKITTHRQLAVETIDLLKTIFPDLPASQSHLTPLPGAPVHGQSFVSYQQATREKYHWLAPEILTHYLETYGTLTDTLLQHCHEPNDLGEAYTPILYEVEVDYLIQNEWVKCAEDLLWRRTKFGLAINEDAQVKLAQKMCLARSMNPADKP